MGVCTCTMTSWKNDLWIRLHIKSIGGKTLIIFGTQIPPLEVYVIAIIALNSLNPDDIHYKFINTLEINMS